MVALWFPGDSPKVTHGYPMVTPGLSHDNPWYPHGYPTKVLWKPMVPHGYPVVFPWNTHGSPMDTPTVVQWKPMVASGLSHSSPMVTVPDRRCRILRVVLVRRWQPGFWEFGGGRVEQGEVSLQAT
jgi:hypothetical protein